MNIICQKNVLNEAVISVSKAVSSHSNLPILEGIYINASQDGSITLISNDMEIGIECKINATVQRPGQTVLNAKILGSIVKNLPAEDVYIDIDDKNICTIKSGNSKFEISCMNPLDFPDLPIVDPDYSIKISKKTLKEMMADAQLFAKMCEIRGI